VQAAETPCARELSDRATALYTQARYSEAEPAYRQALQAWGKMGTDGALGRAIDTRNLGAVLRVLGRYNEAEPLLTESVSELEAAGAGTMDVCRALINLAALYRVRGELTQAENFARRAVLQMAANPEGEPAERLGPSVVLASVYVEQGRLAEAEPILESSLDAADGALAVVVYDDLATIKNSRSRHPEAEGLARQALHFAKLALPPDHPAVAASWTNLALACRLQGNYLEAENAYRQAIAVWENSVGPTHPDLARGLMNLASFYHERGREAGAEDLYRRALTILERAYGKNDSRTLMARNDLADVLRAQRRFTEAGKLERATLPALEKSLAPDDPRLVQAHANYTRLVKEGNR
jgi:tetratricopeptide (TPR) repeat protein